MKKALLLIIFITLTGCDNKTKDEISNINEIPKIDKSVSQLNTDENTINKITDSWKIYTTATYPIFQFKYPENWTTQTKNLDKLICESIFEYDYADGPGTSRIEDCSAGISVIQKFSSDSYAKCIKKNNSSLTYYECPIEYKDDIDAIDIFTIKAYYLEDDGNFGISFDIHVEKNKYTTKEIENKYKDIYSNIFNSVTPLEKEQ